jgi:2-polyprenyl-3-methyl-5-hydroxy-6-metoxy-1,4-benzoquinol methylase
MKYLDESDTSSRTKVALHLAMARNLRNMMDQRGARAACFRAVREDRKVVLSVLWWRLAVGAFLPSSIAAAMRRRRTRRSNTRSSVDRHPPERIDPHAEPLGIVSHHLVRYRFASGLLDKGAVCLDVGCGMGYGTASLADAGAVVVGVDVDGGALRTASSRYATGSFIQADALSLCFRDHSFDTVVCFEAIEHLRDPRTHLREVVRVLRPEGTYVVSTPMAGTGGSPQLNPFHATEFSLADFRVLLNGFFTSVEILGQSRRRSSGQALLRRLDLVGIRKWRVTRPAVRALSRALGTRPTEEATLEDFSIGPLSPDTTEMVAVCRGPAPERAR